MNRRVEKFREKAEVQGSYSDPLGLPLTINVAVVSRWGPGDNFTRHERPDLSLSLITQGNATYSQDGRQGRVMRGQIFLAHKSSSQALYSGGEGFLHKRSVILSGSIVDAVVASLRLKDVDVVTPRHYSRTLGLFRAAYHCLKAKPPDHAKTLSSLAWEILVDCREGVSLDYPAPLRRAIDYIVVNIHHPVTAPGIAGHAGVSVRQCARLFEAHLGCSPMDFCTRQRMTIAQNMVLHSSNSFKQIAAAVGYEDQLYFSARFRRYFGMSPTDCRRQAHPQ